MMRRALTSNAVIDRLHGRRRQIVKTHTRKGVVFSFDDSMQVVPRSVAERMIAKGILLDAGDAIAGGGQTYRLAPAWGGVDERA